MVEIIGWTLLSISGLSLITLVIGMVVDEEMLAGISGCLCFISFCGFGVCAVMLHSGEHKRLMKQCMDSGKQEFECVSILREPTSTVIPMPIIIPSGR